MSRPFADAAWRWPRMLFNWVPPALLFRKCGIIMSEPIKFIALASPSLASGTILAHLLRSTPIKLAKVYVDLFEDKRGKRKPGPGRSKTRKLGRWQTARRHLALARVMPRVYFFRLLKRSLQISELRFLYWCERASPGFFRRMCGFPLPEQLPAHPWLHTFEEVVRKHSLPVVSVASLNAPEAVHGLRRDAPDVILGLGTRILKPEVLATARIGVLNAHSSLLPEYRGGATEFWQLVGGETETGVTIHWMHTQVDSGEICLQGRWPIPKGANHHQLRLMSLFYRLELWREVVQALIDGKVMRQPQGPSHTPTFRRPTLDQQYDFYCRGIHVS